MKLITLSQQNELIRYMDNVKVNHAIFFAKLGVNDINEIPYERLSKAYQILDTK